jgi:hypothetical protein
MFMLSLGCSWLMRRPHRHLGPCPTLMCCCCWLSGLCVQLPETGYLAQVPMLQVFQQLVELRESGKVLRDVHPSHQQQGMDRQYSDTKDILETWRCVCVTVGVLGACGVCPWVRGGCAGGGGIFWRGYLQGGVLLSSRGRALSGQIM